MPKFSNSSLKRLSTCNSHLQNILKIAIKNTPIDFGVSSGHRTPDHQFELYQKGRSQHKNGSWFVTNSNEVVTNTDGRIKQSDHNHWPSNAVDIIAYVKGKYTYDKKYYIYLAGYFKAIANYVDIDLRWGGDFDNDGDILEKNTFWDLCHFYTK